MLPAPPYKLTPTQRQYSALRVYKVKWKRKAAETEKSDSVNF